MAPKTDYVPYDPESEGETGDDPRVIVARSYSPTGAREAAALLKGKGIDASYEFPGLATYIWTGDDVNSPTQCIVVPQSQADDAATHLMDWDALDAIIVWGESSFDDAVSEDGPKDSGEDENLIPINKGADLVRRALIAAILGVLVPLLPLYALSSLSKAQKIGIPASHRTKATVALIIAIPWSLFWLAWLGLLVFVLIETVRSI